MLEYLKNNKVTIKIRPDKKEGNNVNGTTTNQESNHDDMILQK